MAWIKHRRPRLYSWRDYLTGDEAAKAAKLEAREKRTPAQQYELQLIRNRAIQRARYEAKKR